MQHVEGLVTSVESCLNARLNEKSDFLHHFSGKVECILESISLQAWEQKGTTETVDVTNEDTYQILPTIIFDNDTPVDVGDEVESEMVSFSVREPVMVRKQKRSHFYLSPTLTNLPKLEGGRRASHPTMPSVG